MSEKKRCIECRKKYKPNHRTTDRQKYCSSKCRNNHWSVKKLISKFLHDWEGLRHQCTDNDESWEYYVRIYEKWEKMQK